MGLQETWWNFGVVLGVSVPSWILFAIALGAGDVPVGGPDPGHVSALSGLQIVLILLYVGVSNSYFDDE